MFPELVRGSLTYSGPAKSSPTCVNGGSSETRLSGKSAKCVGLHGVVSYLRQTTHRLMIFFTVSRPRKIHNRSLKVVKVAFMPECLTRS